MPRDQYGISPPEKQAFLYRGIPTRKVSRLSQNQAIIIIINKYFNKVTASVIYIAINMGFVVTI